MKSHQSLNHTKWDCKYHVVFIPKRRRKILYGNIRSELGKIFHKLAAQKGLRIEEGHMHKDHVHMCLSIPPKLAVSGAVGFLKGKSAIAVARDIKGRKRNFSGEKFLGTRVLRDHSRSG